MKPTIWIANVVSGGRSQNIEYQLGEYGTIKAHWEAVAKYLRTGCTDSLAQFHGVSVGGLVLDTDTEQLEKYRRYLEGNTPCTETVS